MKSILSIQILRGLSAWMVVYHHYMQIFYNFNYTTPIGAFFVNYGTLGIDVFFVISGFVMFYSQTKKTRTARQFLFERILRIVPAYWFYTFITIISAYFCTNLIVYNWTIESLIKSLLFIPHENPAKLGWVPLLTVGWTLNYEMLFYVVLSLCIFLCKPYHFLIAAILFIALPLSWKDNWVLSIILTNNRLSEFSIGIILGFLYSRNYFNNKLFIIITTLFVYFFIKNDMFSMLHIYASFAVFIALYFEKKINPNHRIYQLLLLLGRVSYSTYLLHAIILSIINNFIFSVYSINIEIIMLPLMSIGIAALSYLSYKYIENGFIVNYAKNILNNG